MIVNYCGEFTFSNNKVEYTDNTKTSASLLLKAPRIVSITESNFIKSVTDLHASIEIENNNDESTTIISKCEFIDCKCSEYIIRNLRGIVEFNSNTISFETIDNSCGAIEFGNQGFKCENCKFIKTNAEGAIKFAQSLEGGTAIVNKCIFDGCAGPNIRCFDIMLYNGILTFSKNVFENMIESGNSGYLGGISGMEHMTKVLFTNITFQNNAFDSDYGGGTGLWILDTDTIEFEDCKFINNIALKSTISRKQRPNNEDYFTGDGGGIQYGFSKTIHDVKMIFTSCEFKRNKAVRHGGAIALQTIQTIANGITYRNSIRITNKNTNRNTNTRDF